MQATYGPKVDYRLCNGCRRCYDLCPMDVFTWDGDKGMPTVAYPGECCYCDICELECLEQAIDLEIPLFAKIYRGIYPEGVS